MIYLKNTTDAQTVFIPRDTDLTGTLLFTARSTVGLDIPISATMLDLKVHRLCYALAVTLPEDIATGEYEYRLTAGGNLGISKTEDKKPQGRRGLDESTSAGRNFRNSLSDPGPTSEDGTKAGICYGKGKQGPGPMVRR